MIKVVIFDADGIVVHREMYFSQRLSQEFGVPIEKIMPFFQNEFKLCLIGKTDLKVELAKYLGLWGWQKSVEDLLAFWFEYESNLDQPILESVKVLRSKGVKCYLSTNNEKYRAQYLWETLGLKNFFDGAFLSTEFGFLKSELGFWSAVYNQLGQPDKSKVLVFDDDKGNIAAAKSFGFNSELYSDFEAYQDIIKSKITN